MPIALDPGDGAPIGLDALVAALADSPVDARDADGLASLGPLFARLGRNPDFLAAMAVDELLRRTGEARPLYGPQVLMLHPPDGRFLLRACFWPAADDAVTRAAGPASFFYGLPHDHNFSFLSYGYFGPGYESDDYEYDGWSVGGRPGDPAQLVRIGRRRLNPGALVLYRARRDVHCQLPPAALSVSLNLMAFDPAQPWIDQYRFDLGRGTIAECLTAAPSEALLALALPFGEGADVAARIARHHPSPRLRHAAITALAAEAPEYWWEVAADDPALGETARARLAALGGD